jgi:hypothetical protein
MPGAVIGADGIEFVLDVNQIGTILARLAEPRKCQEDVQVPEL